jgi:hypothetical protein
MNRRYLLLLLPLLALCYGGYIKYKEITMPPPLVFLIPDEYFGPVFFLFGQPDGVDVQRDPLGNAVRVPENGIVKLKDRSGHLVGESSESHRAVYMVSVSKTGERKILKESIGQQQNDDGSWWAGYIDENGKVNKFPFDRATKKVPSVFLFPVSTRDEKMVLQHDICANQFREPDDPPEKVTACGKFLVVSPNQFVNSPDFMWDKLQHNFYSVSQLVDEANVTASEKRKYYKLP